MASYYSVHVRLMRKRGSAKSYPCAAHPDHLAQTWCYTGLAVEQKVGATHSGGRKGSGKAYPHISAYSDDINDYVPLCRKEHYRLDAVHRNAANTITGEEDESGWWLL